jgi:hypothetical protein
MYQLYQKPIQCEDSQLKEGDKNNSFATKISIKNPLPIIEQRI